MTKLLYHQSSRKSKNWLKSSIPCDRKSANIAGTKQFFRDENEFIRDVPEEMMESNVEFQEEIEQKLTYGIDQMFIEEWKMTKLRETKKANILSWFRCPI